MKNQGIITKKSNLNFKDTYAKLKDIIASNPNLNVLFELDHQKNARSVGLKLSPTKIIFFGNPKLGTALMNSGEFTGLDLPQKILVSEEKGEVYISYNDPEYLKNRHSITEEGEILFKIGSALHTITTVASKV